MYNFLECEIEEVEVEISAEATVELKLEIPSGKYFLNGSVTICYEDHDYYNDYWLKCVYADIITQDGDDIAKISIDSLSKLSDTTKAVFKDILNRIDVDYKISENQ